MEGQLPLTIGRQSFVVTKPQLQKLAGEFGFQAADFAKTEPASSLIYAEVVTLLTLNGGTALQIDAAWEELELTVEPFACERARAAGLLVARTRKRGLSLADRASLALAIELGLPVFTADRAWGNLDIGVDVRVIR